MVRDISSYQIAKQYHKDHDYDAAFHYYRLALKNQPDSAEIHYNFAVCAVQLEEIALALTHFQEVLRLFPKHAPTYQQMASIFMKMRYFEQAQFCYEILLEEEGFLGTTLYNLGVAYLAQGQLTEAFSSLSEALVCLPDDVDALYNLGVVFLRQKDLENAKTYFERVLSENPSYVAAQINLAKIAHDQNQPILALKFYEQALLNDPKHEGIQYAVAMLKAEGVFDRAPPQYLENLFDHYAEHFDSHLTSELHSRLPEEIERMLNENKIIGLSSVLDLGCGTGSLAAILRSRTALLSGLDLSSEMLRKAKEKEFYDILLMGDYYELLLAELEKFELIVAADTFVYVGDLSVSFHLCFKALEEKGYLIFNLEVTNFEPYSWQNNGRYAHSEKYLRETLEKSDFACVDFKKVETRQQNGAWVPCYLVLCQKKASS